MQNDRRVSRAKLRFALILARFLTVPWFFVFTASILHIVYLTHFSPLKNYGHTSERFAHVMEMAYTASGQPNRIPVSVLDMLWHSIPQQVGYMSAQPCGQWDLKVRSTYCGKSAPTPLPLRELTKIPLNPTDTYYFVASDGANQFPLIGWLPFVIGALIGILLKLSPVLIVYLAVTVNAIAMIVLGFFTLRLLPVLRWPICYFLLCPNAIAVRTFIMPDALALDLCCFLIAIVLHLKYHPRVLSGKQQAGLVLLSVIVGLVKVAYCALPLILLLVPTICFGGKGKKTALILMAIIYAFDASLLWGVYAVIRFFPWIADYSASGLHSHASSFGQIYFIVMHPLQFLRGVYAPFLGKDMIANSDRILMWDGIAYSALKLIWLAPLLCAALEPGQLFTWRDRLIALNVLLLEIGVVVSVRFIIITHDLQWHMTHHFYVLGRYLLPVAPLLPVFALSAIPLPGRLKRIIFPLPVLFLLACLAYLHNCQLQDRLGMF